MNIKQALFIVLLGSSAFVSINALNAIYYLEITQYLLAQIIIGPMVALLLLRGKYKQYLIPVIIFIVSLAGTIGILRVIGKVARAYLYGNDLAYSNSTYIFHSLVSIIFIAVFFIYLTFYKRY